MDSSEVAWRNKAACRPKPGATRDEVAAGIALFFEGAPHWTEARKMCGACRVQQLCLKWAVDHDDGKVPADLLQGFFGGHTQNERAALAQEWRNDG